MNVAVPSHYQQSVSSAELSKPTVRLSVISKCFVSACGIDPLHLGDILINCVGCTHFSFCKTVLHVKWAVFVTLGRSNVSAKAKVRQCDMTSQKYSLKI